MINSNYVGKSKVGYNANRSKQKIATIKNGETPTQKYFGALRDLKMRLNISTLFRRSFSRQQRQQRQKPNLICKKDCCLLMRQKSAATISLNFRRYNIFLEICKILLGCAKCCFHAYFNVRKW